MARAKRNKRQRRKSPVDELNLTPMIDVVFQLLVYFVLTFEPIDVWTFMNIYRPTNAGGPPPAVKPEILTISVFPGRLMIDTKMVTLAGLEPVLTSVAELNPGTTTMIKTSSASLHKELVDVLDLCAKAGLTNISVTSM